MTKPALPRPGAAGSPAIGVPRFASPIALAPTVGADPAADLRPMAPAAPPDDGPGAVDAGLRQRYWLVEDQDGRAALAGPALALGDAVDAEAAALFVRRFGARAIDLPTVIVDDGTGPGAHQTAVAAGAQPEQPIDHRIAATACQACAALLGDQPLGGQGEALTWRGRVLRPAGQRLAASSELRLRALALVGSAEQVAIGSTLLPGLIRELAAGFDLPCQIRDRRPADAAGPQQTIVLSPAPPGRQAHPGLIAGAIWTAGGRGQAGPGPTTNEGHPATIVWLGLALERWVRASFARHGFEPGGWPARTRAQVFG